MNPFHKRHSIPVKDLMCFLARTFPIEPVSMIEVMVPKEGTRNTKERGCREFIWSERRVQSRFVM